MRRNARTDRENGLGPARWIWLAGERETVNCHLLLRRRFALRGEPSRARLRIAAGDQYRLFVNGRPIGDGPARAVTPEAWYDTYDLAALGLARGDNVIAVLAHNTMMAQHGQSLCPGGIWVDIECHTESGEAVRFGTDGTWRAALAPHFAKPAPRRFFPVGFNEKIVFSAEPAGWTQPRFDDSAWPRAQVVDDRFCANLTERPMPMLEVRPWKPVKVRRWGTFETSGAVFGLAFDKCEPLPPGGELRFSTCIRPDRAGKAQLAFGCDNWARVSLNGKPIWEQGRPDAGFHRHLGVTVERYGGMVQGNGHRHEPGSTRGGGGKQDVEVRFRRGWNLLEIWIWRPRVAYGFEICFTDPKTGRPIIATCSATKDERAPDTWAVSAEEGRPPESGRIVQATVAGMRPFLEPSHLADWDDQHEEAGAPPGAASLLAGREGDGPMALRPGQFVEFQLPADGAGYIDLVLRGPKGSLVDVTCSEAQWGLGGRIRSMYNGLWQTDRLVLSGRTDRWLSLDRRAGRYLAIAVRHAEGPVEVRRFALNSLHYPVSRPGRFECSDRVLAEMWQVGAATVDAATFDVAEDCPTREKAQWLGDTNLRLFEIAALWGDVRLSAIALREFAEDQKDDRWAKAILPCGYASRLADYCVLLPRWAMDHYGLSGDASVLRDTFPGIERLFALVAEQSDSQGFLRPKDAGAYVDYSMGPVRERCEVIAAVQAMLLAGLDAASAQAGLLGRSGRAAEWRGQASRLRERLRRRLWVEKRRLFADGLKAGAAIASFTAVTNYWMLYANVPDPAQEAQVLARLWPRPAREDMSLWSLGESPYTKFFVSEALLSRGLWRQAFAHWRGYYGSMFAHPEAWSCFEMWQRDWSPKKPLPRNSLVHPFGIGPMAHLAFFVAGVKPLRPGFDGILWEPMPGDLRSLRAEFPLVGRDSTVRIEMEPLRPRGRRLILSVPKATLVRVSDKYLDPADRTIVEEKRR